jgi:quinol monooxygenase YgiN
MRPIIQLVLAIAILTAPLAEPARGQDGAVDIATYIEVVPNAVDSAAALLGRHRDASRKEDGNLRFDVLQEVARPNRFALLEAWKDKAALEGYEKAESTLHFRDKLKAIQAAPPDERVGLPWMAARWSGKVEPVQSLSLPTSTSSPSTRTIASLCSGP